MKITSRILATLVCAVFIGWVSSCSSPEKQEENDAQEFDQAKDELQEQIEAIVYQIPSPSEIPYILQSTGVELDESLVNDLDKASQYQGDDDKSALNLGVYSTDVGYLSSYEQAQKALTYFSTLKGMADQIGVTTTVDSEVLNRFENNLDSRDSLANILDDALENTDKVLKNSGRDRAAALVLAGSFVEGLYISSSLVKNYPRDILSEENRKLMLIPLVKNILNQEVPLKDLHALLGTLESDETVDNLKSMIQDLSDQYASLDIDEKVSNNEGMTLLEDENLNALHEKIAAARAFITG